MRIAQGPGRAGGARPISAPWRTLASLADGGWVGGGGREGGRERRVGGEVEGVIERGR